MYVHGDGHNEKMLKSVKINLNLRLTRLINQDEQTMTQWTNCKLPHLKHLRGLLSNYDIMNKHVWNYFQTSTSQICTQIQKN